MKECAVHERANTIITNLLEMDAMLSMPIEDRSADDEALQDYAVGRLWVRTALYTLKGVLQSPCDTPADEAFTEFLDEVDRQSKALRKEMLS